ncbi:hypothetical protein GCK32_007374 [Trichostrongylus colubriformis]|uniref:Uncharacterized protein n=1 Tax=Trichostrongylus colubriformis TaxID=6319 RepID=A0AAN8FQ43_TRICO
MVGGRPGSTPIRGRFAAKTPRQSIGFPGAQYSSHGATSSDSDIKVVKLAPPAPKRGKREAIALLLLPFIKMAIFVSAMIIIGQVFFIVTTFMVRHIHHQGVWESHEYPAEVHFNEIAVSSTSQSCNELARVMISEEFTIFAIAFAIQLCLGLAEPHRSGFGGVSTAVFVEGNKKDSKVVDGFWEFSTDPFITNISGADDTKREEIERLALSILVPSDVSIAKYFLDNIEALEFRRLWNFFKEYGIDTNPVSYSLFRAINHNTLQLLHDDNFEWLFNAKEQFRPLDEGEVFTRKLNLDQLLALRASAKKGNHEIMKTSLEHIMKMFKHKNIGFFSNFTEERWSRVITEACHDVSKTSSMMLCTPRRLGKLISKVFLDEGLYGEQRLMLDEAMRRLKIFQIFWRLIDEEPMSSPPADTPKRNVQHEHNKHHTDEIVSLT